VTSPFSSLDLEQLSSSTSFPSPISNLHHPKQNHVRDKLITARQTDMHSMHPGDKPIDQFDMEWTVCSLT